MNECYINWYYHLIAHYLIVKSKITFPTDGNPINATLASPDFITSKPSP